MSTSAALFTGPQYKSYLESGGQIEGRFAASELGIDSELESFSTIRRKLTTGFELPPTLAAQDPSAYFEIARNGDALTRAIAYTYAHGGKVIYRKQPEGDYIVTFSIPLPAST